MDWANLPIRTIGERTSDDYKIKVMNHCPFEIQILVAIESPIRGAGTCQQVFTLQELNSCTWRRTGCCPMGIYSSRYNQTILITAKCPVRMVVDERWFSENSRKTQIAAGNVLNGLVVDTSQIKTIGERSKGNFAIKVENQCPFEIQVVVAIESASLATGACQDVFSIPEYSSWTWRRTGCCPMGIYSSRYNQTILINVNGPATLGVDERWFSVNTRKTLMQNGNILKSHRRHFED